MIDKSSNMKNACNTLNQKVTKYIKSKGKKWLSHVCIRMYCIDQVVPSQVHKE